MELSRQMLLLTAENYGSYYLHITKATKPQSNQTTMAKVDKISQNEEEKRNNLTYFLPF